MGPVADGGQGMFWEYPLVCCSRCTTAKGCQSSVKALPTSLALLGMKDVWDLLTVPRQASSSSLVCVRQLCVCWQHAAWARNFQNLPFGRVRNLLPLVQTWFVWFLAQITLVLPYVFARLGPFSLSQVEPWLFRIRLLNLRSM